MNRLQKEQYLREYSILKAKGKPFFPYAVAKDGAMACLVMVAIIGLAVLLGAELGPKADPTTTTYVPRPDWYFFFLFELLRVIKPPVLTPMATIGIPTIALILLILLPFYDRNPERRPERRPVATTAGILTIVAMGYLTYLGAHGGSTGRIEGLEAPAELSQQEVATYEQGRLVTAQSGCLACHMVGESGNDGPGPELTDIGDRLPREAIQRSLLNATAPMPSYDNLEPEKLEAMVEFLSQLR
jgi:menaquinol-cytochrome c reductase cytochrome b/c subunit